MGSVIALLPANGWPRLLCDAVWQSTLIAAFGWLTARFLVRQPAARAWVLLFSLTACVLAPLASMAARGSGWTIMAQADGATLPQAVGGERNSATTQVVVDRAAVPPLGALSNPSDVSPHQIPAGPTVTFQRRSGFQPDSQAKSLTYGYGWLAVAWLATSTLLAMRLLLSCLATWRLLRAAALCDDAALRAANATAAQRIGLRNAPALLVSGHVQTPTIFALGRPRLLIPADHARRAADGKSIDWVAAFAHELAHVARGDGWTRLWVELVLIALPLQPLVWLARRAFHTACEEACDDWAVATGSNPVDLAETLTAWITKSKPIAPVVAIGMSSTKARTLRLLALRDKPVIQLNRAWRWAGIPVAILLIAAFAVAQSPSGEQKKPDLPPTPVTASKGDNKSPNDKTAGSSDKSSGKSDRGTLPPYIIEPPDILTIAPVQLVPKESTRVVPLDKVRIEVHGTLVDQPITGMFQVDSSGEVVLGPAYGAVKISGLMRLEAQDVVKKKLLELLTQPEVALTIDESRRESGISGKHLVAPDGRINLGIYGTVSVAGLTITQARAAVEKKLSESFAEPKVSVDLSAFNSKVFYVVLANQLQRLPITGSETVMDVMSQLNAAPDGIESIAISRPASATSKARGLEVHWKDVLQGDDTTNYQILPGDRVFVHFAQLSPGVEALPPRPGESAGVGGGGGKAGQFQGR